MIPIKKKDPKRSLDPGDVGRLEKALGCTLPLDYRAFLLEHNVAMPEANEFRAGKFVTSVSKFFGISEQPGDDIVHQNTETYQGRIAKGLIAIALAAGGNLICLDHKSGSVFFWDHEKESLGSGKPSRRNVVMLSQTFAEFLALLQAPSKAASPSPDVISVKLKPGFREKFKDYL